MSSGARLLGITRGSVSPAAAVAARAVVRSSLESLAPRVEELIRDGWSNRRIAQEVGSSKDAVRRFRARSSAPAPVDDLSHDADQFEEVPVIIRDYTHLDSMYVYPLGDVHIGARMHQAKRWTEWLGYLAGNKNTSMLGLGDYLNSAIVGSKSDVYEETMTVGDAKRLLRGQLTPLARDGRIDLMMPGNHEERVSRAVGECPIQDVAEWLEVPYARSAAMVVYRVGDMEYDFWVRHGTGSGQSMVALKKGSTTAAADVYVTGHVHNQSIAADEQFIREGEKVVRRRRYYVSSGSFLSAESYALERGYTPTRIGAPRVYLDGRRRDVHVSL